MAERGQLVGARCRHRRWHVECAGRCSSMTALPLEVSNGKWHRAVYGHNYVVMAYRIMAYIVMAYVVMAHIVMAYIVMEVSNGKWHRAPSLHTSLTSHPLYHGLSPSAASVVEYVLIMIIIIIMIGRLRRRVRFNNVAACRRRTPRGLRPIGMGVSARDLSETLPQGILVAPRP